MEVWGRERYLSVTTAHHNTEFYEWMGKKHFCSFQTAETGKRTPNFTMKGSGANHYPRAPAQYLHWQIFLEGVIRWSRKCEGEVQYGNGPKSN